jgi:hypothetical protein
LGDSICKGKALDCGFAVMLYLIRFVSDVVCLLLSLGVLTPSAVVVARLKNYPNDIVVLFYECISLPFGF